MQTKVTTVYEYLDELPADRRQILNAVRKVILANLDKKSIEEGIQYGMIGYFVPHRVYPQGYHCDPKQPLPFAVLASQKNHCSLYLNCVYFSELYARQFQQEWTKTGKKLDMGKACIRFKKLDDLALDVIATTLKRVTAMRFIEQYELAIQKTSADKAARTQSKAAQKKKVPATKKVAKKKVTKEIAKNIVKGNSR